MSASPSQPAERRTSRAVAFGPGPAILPAVFGRLARDPRHAGQPQASDRRCAPPDGPARALLGGFRRLVPSGRPTHYRGSRHTGDVDRRGDMVSNILRQLDLDTASVTERRLFDLAHPEFAKRVEGRRTLTLPLPRRLRRTRAVCTRLEERNSLFSRS